MSIDAGMYFKNSILIYLKKIKMLSKQETEGNVFNLLMSMSETLQLTLYLIVKGLVTSI